MLSPTLLDILREWWRIGRPVAWLFPGQNPVNPLTTRQLKPITSPDVAALWRGVCY